MGKGRRVIEKIGKKQTLHKVGIVATKIQQQPVACCSDYLRQKCRGRAAAAWPAIGSRKVLENRKFFLLRSLLLFLIVQGPLFPFWRCGSADSTAPLVTEPG